MPACASASITGPMSVARSQGSPSARSSIAPNSISVHGVGHVLLHVKAAQRRAALARRLEGGGEDVAHGLFGQGGGVHDHGVEAAGFGDQRGGGVEVVGHAAADRLRGVGRAGEGHAVHAGVAGQGRADRCRRRAEVAARRAGRRPRCSRSTARAAISGVCSAGLASTALPAARAAAIWPEKMASGKFQGRCRRRCRARGASGWSACGGVVAQEIHRLAQFGHGVGQGLARLARQKREDAAEVGLVEVGGAVQDLGAFGGGGGPGFGQAAGRSRTSAALAVRTWPTRRAGGGVQ